MQHGVVFIDHNEAKIFHITGEGFDVSTVKSHHARSGRHQQAGQKHEPDQKHLHDVAVALKGFDEILVVGPGTAKGELLSHMEHHDHDVKKKVVAVEPCDHPTDKQIVALARKAFHRIDAMR